MSQKVILTAIIFLIAGAILGVLIQSRFQPIKGMQSKAAPAPSEYVCSRAAEIVSMITMSLNGEIKNSLRWTQADLNRWENILDACDDIYAI